MKSKEEIRTELNRILDDQFGSYYDDWIQEIIRESTGKVRHSIAQTIEKQGK